MSNPANETKSAVEKEDHNCDEVQAGVATQGEVATAPPDNAIPAMDPLFMKFKGNKGFNLVASAGGDDARTWLANMAIDRASQGENVVLVTRDSEAVVLRMLGRICLDGSNVAVVPLPATLRIIPLAKGDPVNIASELADNCDVIMFMGILASYGLERFNSGRRDVLEEAAHQLSEIAKANGIEIWEMSSVRHQAKQLETPSLADVVENRQLSDTCDGLIMIGPVPACRDLRTLVPWSSGDAWLHEVSRLVVSEHGRMWEVPRGARRIEADCTNSFREPVFVNRVPMTSDTNEHDVDSADLDVCDSGLRGLTPWADMDGYIPMDRRITQRSAYTSRAYEELGLITVLHVDANIETRMRRAPGGGRRTVPVHRGEMIVSYKVLMKKYGGSEKRWRSMLEAWEDDGTISIDYVLPDEHGHYIRVPKKGFEGNVHAIKGHIIKLRDYVIFSEEEGSYKKRKGKSGGDSQRYSGAVKRTT